MKEQLETFVAAQLPGATGVEVRNLEPISSVGNARQAWSFDLFWSTDGRTHELGCVMLVKAPAGQLETEMKTEFATMRALYGSGVPIPRVLWLDQTGDVVGNPFFASERMPGTADMVSVVRLPAGADQGRRLAKDMARALAALHTVDPKALEIDLPAVTEETAAGAQLHHWEETFERLRMEPHPVVTFAFRWMRANAPVAARVSVVHGDFRLGNVLYVGDRVTAVLDWEMVHLGDPLEDLAWAYRTIWSMERHLPFAEFVAQWSAATGIQVDTDALLWYRLFNEVKHTVIALTAARSFHEGRTQFIRHGDRATNLPAFMGTFLELLP